MKTNNILPSRLALCVAAGLGLGLSAPAWADAAKSMEYLRDAQDYMAENDLAAALIQLRNAVKEDPNNAEARFLLGSAYLDSGNVLSAEKELQAAQDLGFDESRIRPVMGDILLAQGKASEIIERMSIDGLAPRDAARMSVVLGQAFLALGNRDDAHAAFREASKADPDNARAVLGLARVSLLRDDEAGADAHSIRAEQLAQSSAVKADALALRAELRRRRGDNEGAVELLDKAIAADGRALMARMSRAVINLTQKNLDSAEADAQAILAAMPNHPAGIFIRAAVLVGREQLPQAFDLLQSHNELQLAAYPPNLYLLGMLRFQRSELEQATRLLTDYVAKAPNDIRGRKMLGQVLLRQDSWQRAIQVLAPAAEAAPQDVELQVLLAGAYKQTGQTQQAEDIILRAAELSATDAAGRTKVALGRLALGQDQAAIADLEAAIELGPQDSEARLLLVLTQLRQQDPKAALPGAKMLVEDRPEDAASRIVLAAVHAALGETDQARAQLEEALRLRPDYPAALFNLAGLEAMAGNFDDARQHLKKVIDGDPKASRAMVALADIALNQDKPEEAVDWLIKARDTNPEAIRPRLALIETYLSMERPQDALDAARDMQHQMPSNPTALDVLARTEALNGNLSNAAAIARRAADLAPDNAPIQHNLAGYLRAQNDLNGAERYLRRALAANPDFIGAQIDLVAAVATLGRDEDAMTLAREFKERNPETVSGDVMLGTAHMAAARFKEAAQAFEAAFTKQSDQGTLTLLAQALAQSGQRDAAILRLTNWISTRPEDDTARLVLADLFMTQGDFGKALPHQMQLLDKRPTDPVLLNNIAWVMSQQNDPKALDYAKRAYAAAPDHPSVLDTYGVILVDSGDVAMGLSLLRRAHEAMPGNPAISMNLAKALQKANRAEEARALLTELVAETGAPPEAQRMLEQLN